MARITTLRRALTKHAEYRRTRRELRRLPIDVALDLEIDRDEAGRVAARAVYG